MLGGLLRTAWQGVCRLAVTPASRVRWKILAPFIALSLVVSLVGTYLATRLVSAPLEERFANQLVEAARVASDSIRRIEQDQLAVVRSVAFTEGVPAAVARGDRDAVEQLVGPIVANAGVEAVYVLDAWGRPILTAEAPGAPETPAPTPVDAASWPFVARVLAGETDALGDKFAGLAATGIGEALLVAGPIRYGDVLVGTVVVGTSTNTIARLVKQQALADLTVFGNEGSVAASSFAGSFEDLEAMPSGEAASGALLPWRVAERDYTSVTAPLEIRGETVATLAVSLPNDFLATAQASTQGGAAVFFAALTVAVLVIGWSLSRLFTGPLSRLVQTSRQVAAGDLTLKSGIVRRDEIGDLATSFDSMTEALRRQHLGALEALVSAVDARDPYTRGHSVRVGHLARELGIAMGLSPRDVYCFQLGGYFHDIGKIGIRDAVLLKPGALTPEERAIIQTHPSVGYQILAPVGLPHTVLEAVVGHHERLDGSGYPLGLRGDEVPLAARVVTVADVYDALITDRPYRAGLELSQVLAMLQKDATAGLVDPDIVAVLATIADAWEVQRRSEPEILRFDAVELDPEMFRAAVA